MAASRKPGAKPGKKAGTNWFAVVIATITVVALVGVGFLVVYLNNKATAPGEAPQGAIINSETGAINFGSGPEAVALYVDFMCPACGHFEEVYGQALKSAVDDGRITLQMHPIAIQDNLSQGTQFSSRAGSAFYCVASEAPDAAMDFQILMFANQPSQGSTGLSDAQIIEIAEMAGGGAAANCIKAGTYKKFVQDQTILTPPDPETGRIATPTVMHNGERVPSSEVGTVLARLLG